MSEIKAEDYARRLLGEGRDFDTVVDETGLEGLAEQVQTHAQRRGIPAAARSRLAKAALAIEDAEKIIAADGGKAAKRAELEKLQDKVKALKAELRGGRDWKAVRSWARDNGYEVGNVGILKKAIVDAYDQAAVAS